MSNAGPVVVGKDGLRGTLVQEGHAGNDADTNVVVRFADGLEMIIPRSVLKLQKDGSYYIPLGMADIAAYRAGASVATTDDAHIVLPVVAEELQVGKRRVETGRVRLRTVVTERQETVSVPLQREEIETERVEINQFVDQAPAARREGDDLIIPLLEEVLVVEKRLRLKAEIRVRVKRTTVQEPQQVTLRSEEIAVDRVAAASTSEAGADR